MKMLNNIRSIFNFGNIFQSHTIIYDVRIDTSIKRIEKDFYEGNIKQVFDDLDLLLKENNANKKIKYQLLVKKASFLFSVRKYTEAVSLVDIIKINYNQFIDVLFEEIQLIKLSLDKNEKEFFILADKIIAESGKPLKKEKFEAMYYLNIRDIQKAKDIFIVDGFEKESAESLLLGGHIFSSLHEFEQANQYYQKALSEDISFLDEHIILSFYGTDIINKHFVGQIPPTDHLETIKSYQENIEKILTEKEYFEESYIMNLINNYMFTIILLGDDKEKYIKKYEENCSNELIYIHHYFQYARLQKISINHEEVQQKILNGNKELLLHYIQILEPDNCSEVVKFLDVNIEYIYENEYIFMFYIKCKLAERSLINKDILEYLKEHKFDNIEYLISFIKVGVDLIDDDVQQLIKLVNQDNLIPLRIIETIDILKNINLRNEYLSLAIDNQDKFINTISHTLKVCEQDENLLQSEFDLFISKINNLNENCEWITAIANQYSNFDNYSKAFEFYTKCIGKVVIEKELYLRILEISLNHYIRTKDYIDREKQKQIFEQLIVKKETMSIYEIVFLFQYSLLVVKDTKQILPYLNQYLLKHDIKLLDKQLKIDLSNLFTQTIYGQFGSKYEKLFIYDENIAFVKEGKTFFTNYKIVKENIENFGLEEVDKNRFISIKNNPIYAKDSLFHRIVGPFAFKVDNPNFIPIEIAKNGDEPFKEFFEFTKQLKEQEKELFAKYSSGDYYSLYNLASKEYKNYFTLIPYLLNHKDYTFNGLKPNFLKGKKKILTISSIVFLNEINQLDRVLKHQDIVIQQTLINWLNNYIDNYSPTDRPNGFNYLDETEPKFIPYTKEVEDKAEEFKKMLIALQSKLLNCEIIDDTTSNLPNKDAYKLLASEMGSQEYHAFAFCLLNNYQIISENCIFEMMFEHFSCNKIFIGNSIGILRNMLDEKEMFKLEEKLYSLDYKYLFICIDDLVLIDVLNYYSFISNILNDKFMLMFKIWHKYGCLENLINYYKNEYKVLYPKVISPQKDIFSKNFEYILRTLGIKI